MTKPNKNYSANQLISVATVANTLAKSRSIAGLEALQQLAEAVENRSLCADLYPPHYRCFNSGVLGLVGRPASGSALIWRRMATKAVERYKSDMDDFSYPPAASTWHLLADDVYAFAKNLESNASASAAMRKLAIRYKPELSNLQSDATGLHDKRPNPGGRTEMANVGAIYADSDRRTEALIGETSSLATAQLDVVEGKRTASEVVNDEARSKFALADDPVDAETAKQATSEPAPVVKAKRARAFDLVLPYLQTVFKNGKFKTTQEFTRELTKQAGKTNSPFKESSTSDVAFFLKEGGRSISHSLIEDKMKYIR